jgi:hypothetical protein
MVLSPCACMHAFAHRPAGTNRACPVAAAHRGVECCVVPGGLAGWPAALYVRACPHIYYARTEYMRVMHP